jgi:polyhydroxybutyrate depolymerase
VRDYVIYAPATYTGRTRVPVVLEFHGYGSGAQQQLIYGNLGPQSERDGFLVVAPEGQGATKHFTLEGAVAGEQDDVQFTADLLDHLEGQLCVDTRRIYTTGMSNGGAMSAVLACRLSDRIAAFASVAAVVWGPPCAQARPVPIMAIHGTADDVVPYAGGRVACCGQPTIAAVPDTMANWADHNGCGPTPEESRPAETIVLRSWTGCRAGGATELYIVEGGGHTWPGSRVTVGRLGATSTDLDASEVIWTFFQGHRLPTG